MRRARRRLHDNRGILLISSYLLLSIFVLYTNALTVQTINQAQVADRTREQVQALNLAQGAMEQISDEFYQFLSTNVYQLAYQGNAIKAFQWLDALGQTVANGASPPTPYFILQDRNGDGLITQSDMVGGSIDGVAANPRTITALPTLKNANTDTARSWIGSIVSTNPADPLAIRRLTLQADATVGSTTKRIQAVYDLELGMSDIFRYTYFVNNYGWFDLSGSARMYVRGEVRANGDVTFIGNLSRLVLDGDIYASNNPALINPVTRQPAAGLISGDPNQTASQSAYWKACDTDPCTYHAARPTQNVTFPNQPPIGGTAKVLPPYGQGWDSSSPDQTRFAAQPVQPIPYLGDLNFYKSLAIQTNSSLTYYDSQAGQTKTINATYAGPDGAPNTSDDNNPLVLVGTSARPIVLDGSVVIPGDVVIQGVVSGRGTIYAGRNVHVVGETRYQDPPHWRRIERNQKTGRVARRGSGTSPNASEGNLGTVCNNGAYYLPGAAVPAGCMQ